MGKMHFEFTPLESVTSLLSKLEKNDPSVRWINFSSYRGGYYWLIIVLQVIDLVRALKPIEAHTTQELLEKNRVANLSDDMQVLSDVSISLKCPLSFTRMTIPCRGLCCTHAQTFDLQAFLAYSERFAAWVCPICEVKLALEDLRVDELSAEALRMQPDADSFSFGSDGLSFALDKSTPITPATAKKVKDDHIVDDNGARLLQRIDYAVGSCEARTSESSNDLQKEAASGIAGLLESGIWEYCEEAEVNFSIPRDSPSVSLSRDDSDSDAIFKKSQEVRSQMPMDIHPSEGDGKDEVAGPMKESATREKARTCQKRGSDMLESQRNLRARTKIKYTESSDCVSSESDSE
jgi:hypothetical protein